MASTVVSIPSVQSRKSEDHSLEIISEDDFVVVVDVGTKETVTNQVPPDGGFGWAVATASFFLTFFMTGFLKCASNFGRRVATEWPGTDPTETGWIFGLVGTLSLFCSPATSMVVAQFGFRVAVISGGALCCLGFLLSFFATSAGFLIGSLGVFLGIGSSFVITSAAGCVAKYFTDKKPIAMTLALSGGCLGAFVVPIAVEAILSALGLHYTFLVMGGIFLVVPLLGLLYGPPEAHFVSVTEEVDAKPTTDTVPAESESSGNAVYRFALAVSDKLGLSFLKDHEFLLLATCLFTIQLGNPTFRGYVAAQGKAVGASAEALADYAHYLAAGDLLARVTYGFLSTRSTIVRDVELWVPALVSGILVVVLPFCPAPWLVVVVSTTATCLTSVLTICTPLILSANHGAGNLTKTLGLVRMMQAIASIISRPTSGLLKASLGNAVALCYSGSCLIVASGLAALLWQIRSRRLNAPPVW